VYGRGVHGSDSDARMPMPIDFAAVAGAVDPGAADTIGELISRNDRAR